MAEAPFEVNLHSRKQRTREEILKLLDKASAHRRGAVPSKKAHRAVAAGCISSLLGASQVIRKEMTGGDGLYIAG
jgi:hypothetical protein